VTVTLPNLGPVTALLKLDGSAVAVTITAENDGAVPILENGLARLIEQMEGAGLTPAEISIAHAAA
jgi:flagellar hook-length control protein FliK